MAGWEAIRGWWERLWLRPAEVRNRATVGTHSSAVHGPEFAGSPGRAEIARSDTNTSAPLASAQRTPAVVHLSAPPGHDSKQVASVMGTLRWRPVSVGTPGPRLEPKPTSEKFRSFPFRPDTVVDGWSTGKVTVRGASLRGHAHRYYGQPRQDDFVVHVLPTGRVVVAVADGVGNCVHAHVGATSAVRYVPHWVQAYAAEVGSAIDWDELIRGAAWTIVEQAKTTLGLEEPDRAAAARDFSTTLVVAIVDPRDDGSADVRITDVGDSGAWVLSRGGFESLIAGKSADEGGITSSAVSGLPRVPQTLQVRSVVLEPGEVLLVGTDGIGDPLGSGEGGVGNLFKDVLGVGVPSLLEFANAADFSRETFDDDRTLVAVWPDAAVAAGAEGGDSQTY